MYHTILSVTFQSS